MTIYCTYCGQGFARNEHLQRHVLTHSDLRPFNCPICNITFKRKDLMKKHFLSHHANDFTQKNNATALGTQDSESARALLTKVRSTVACSNCARTKTKCDNDTKQPCTRCRAKGLTCAARATRPRGPRPKLRQGQGQPEAQPEEAQPEDARSNSAANSPAHTHSICSEVKDTPSSAGSGANGYAHAGQEPGPEAGPGARLGLSINAASSSSWSPQGVVAGYPVPSPSSVATALLAPSQHDRTDHSQPASMLWPQGAVDPELFPSMDSVPDAGDPVVFGPSWDFGDPPDDFEYLFNPASSVFGPFLPFACSPPFTMEPLTAVVTNGSKVGVVMPQPQPQPDLQPVPHADATTMEVDTPPGSDTTAPEPRLAVRETGDNDFWTLPKDVEHWTMFQCCPTPSSVCPGRATAHLTFLEESSRLRNSAGLWSLPTRGSPEHVGSNVSLSASTRERLSAITQTFFPRALEMHGLSSASASALNRSASEWFGSSGFILLPPTADLDVFLETYIRCVEPFYPLVPTHTLDPNDLLGASGNEKGAVLLLLLMMAIGASHNRATRARRFGAGLAEVCRIALTDLVEKDNQYSTVPLILQCSLLLTIQSCWGGEKWQMDIGAGHRFMYIAMIRNSGYFQKKTQNLLWDESAVDRGASVHAAWRKWVEQEVSKSRLAYDWVMLDQELSLFYDQPPTFAITELRATLPEIDALWLAKSADEWRALCNSENASRPQYSLRRVFQLCLANEINVDSYHLTPTRLRLLLYPIQSLVFHHSQLLDAVPDKQIRAASSFKTTIRTSSLLRFEELQSLLQTWWALAQQCQHPAPAVTADPGQPLTPPPSESDQVLTSANLLLFHLISLNLYADLKAIEGLARGEDPSCSAGSSSDEAEYTGGVSGHHIISLRTRQRHIAAQCVFAPHDALYHAGQVLRLVRETPLSRRPPWWGAAVYRAALVLWAYASMQQCSSSSSSSSSPAPPPPPPSSREEDGCGRGKQVVIAIDAVLPGDPAVERFLRQRKGLPVLLNGGAGTVRADREPGRVLGACIALLDAGDANTWFTAGVRIKLETLQQAWSTRRLGQGNIVH